MKKFLSLVLSLCMTIGLATQAFAAGGSTDVLLESDVTAPDVLDIVVPAEIPIHMSAAGEIFVARTLAIENRSSKAVEIQAVRAEGKNGWAILDWDADFSDKPTGTKDLALSFRGDGTGADGSVELTDGNWRIEKDGNLPIEAGAKLPLQTETAKTSIATVYWTVDFADGGSSVDPDPDPGDGIEITVLPGKHGMADTDVLYPDADGLVAEYPGVTADTGYDFTHFADASTGDTVDTSTVYTADGAIRPMFALKSGWTSVPVPETPGVTFEPKDDPEILIDPDGVVQVVPGVKPDDGYKTDGFVDGNTGEPVGPGSVIDINITINITINVYPDGSNPGGGDEPDPGDKTVTVPVLPGEHGSADADSVTTGPDGKIDPFPGTTPDEGYLFDHWEDQDGNPVDGDTVLDDGDSIKPVFKPDPDYTPDKTVTVDILPGEHGTCDILTVTTTSEGKIHTYPDVTPDEGWVLDHWENQDGESVDENTVWSEGEGARPVYAEVPVEDVTVSFVASRYNGGISGNTQPVVVSAGTKWSEITTPVTTAAQSATFMGWYVGDEELTPDYEIQSDITAMAVFKSWFTCEGDTVTGLSDAYFAAGSPKRITIPAVINGTSMTTLGSRCLRTSEFTSDDSNGITHITVAAGYTTFADDAFNTDCRDVVSFVFPNTLTTIGQYALYGVGYDSNGALGTLVIPSSVRSIGKISFSRSGWTRITVPDNCVLANDAGDNVFSNCPYLTYLKIGTGTSNFRYTFQQANVLETLILPSTTRVLSGNSSFYKLTALRTCEIWAKRSAVTFDAESILNDSLSAPNATIYWKAG